MPDATGGLSDVLRQMADGEPTSDNMPQQSDLAPTEPDNESVDQADDTALAAAMEDEAGDVIGESTASTTPKAAASPTPEPTRTAPQAAPRPAVSRRPAASNTHQLKATAAPVLVTVGILMLIPAVWAVAILLGIPVWHSQRDGAGQMAIAMMVCWPIALALIAGGIWFFIQVTAEKKNAPPKRVARTRR